MATPTIDEEKLKALLKAAVAEALEEQRELVREIVEEALEDVALARGHRTGTRRRNSLAGTTLGPVNELRCTSRSSVKSRILRLLP
jgi:hypothetical protein